MQLEKFTISLDDKYYHAFPDVVLTNTGKMICVISECIHHTNRDYSRIVYKESMDRGRTWGEKKNLTPSTEGKGFFLNCPKIQKLDDGRLVILVDKIIGKLGEDKSREKARIQMYFSSDDGETWSDAIDTPLRGIMPDKICQTKTGRWLLGCHYNDLEFGKLIQRLWYSDDRGETWQGPVIVGRSEDYNLCEVSILPVEDKLVAFMRENSFTGIDCIKTISEDDGLTWSEPIKFPLPGCHRPVAGYLNDGKIMITYRFLQGGKWGMGKLTQNLFAAILDTESALALKRNDAWARIIPIDHDSSDVSDTAYSGWVQFDDDEIYIVNYLVDDAPRAQIRGYSLTL